MSNITIAEILEKIDIPSFAATLPPPAKKEQKNWLYDCPTCGEVKKLSFFPGVSPKGIPGPWKCNKCGNKGNLYGFVELMLGLSKGDTTKLLKEAAGIVEEPKRRGRKKGGGGGGGSAGEKKKGPLPVAPPSSQRIYHRFVELTHLTDAHREEARVKRGFTDQMIDALCLRSGGDYVAGVLDQLKAEFPADELVLAGVLVRQNNTLIPCEQLIQDRVLIPYLDEQGQVYHLRPHKLGFKDVAPQPYHRRFLGSAPESIVLTEGEFKAAALALGWDIPAVAVPGVSSFAGNYFERLTGLLQEAGVKKVAVIYDNEEKGDPGLPGFKEKIEDRFDVIYWSYILAYKLGKAGFLTTIGTLPADWREQGKIDFDMALAQGRTRQEIEQVVLEAVPPKEYIESLPGETQKIVRRKVARFFKKFAIKREYNKYVAIRTKGDDSYEEVISNFVINIKNNYLTPDGVIRNIEMVNEFGEVSESFTLEPSDMAGGDSFKKFCFSKGNYIFKGSTQDLTNIWDYEFNRDAGTVIHIPDRIGRIKTNLWLFGNMAIKDGKVYRPGEDGVIWIDGEGYKPQSLHLGPKDEPIEDAIPSLYEGKVDIQDIADRMRSCVGGYEAYIGIGWVIMTIFSKDIFARYKCLPFLFPHGKRESGKSSFMRWIIRFFGIESDGISLPETSQNYIMRALGYFSSLGVWFDEYRNEPQVVKKDGYLRSAYNRQLSGKGIKQSFGARGYDVVGTLAVTGEESPKDSGLFTRSCFVQMSSNKRNRSYYDDLNIDCEKFSGFVFHLIMNYGKYRKEILETIADLKKVLVKKKISDRTAENWSILAGCFDAVVKQDQEFAKWVLKTCDELKTSGEEDHQLNQFLEDVNFLLSSKAINAGYFSYEPAHKQLSIWFNGIYEEWCIHRKRTGNNVFDRNSIAKYLTDEPYFKEKKVVRVGLGPKRCFVLDVSKAPDSIIEIASALAENKGEWGEN